MRKYVVVLGILLLLALLIVGFSVPDRIAYAFKGMASYSTEKYNKVITDLPATEITLDFSVYDNEPIKVYEYNENVYLMLDKIEFKGNAYAFYFTSYGTSTFSQGDIIRFLKTAPTEISNEYGEFFFSITGELGIVDETIQFYYALYPIYEGSVSPADLSTMKITIPIDDLGLCHYERK